LSILADEGFLPAFSTEWTGLEEARDGTMSASGCWEVKASFLQILFQRFSKVKTHRLRVREIQLRMEAMDSEPRRGRFTTEICSAAFFG
jgi:hypothetical protein